MDDKQRRARVREIDKAIRKATDKHSARVQEILDDVAARSPSTVQHRKRHG
jgi:hypothetical protein